MTGKDRCNYLKAIRMKIASMNGIAYTPRECTHEGDCLGHCPACDEEAEGLLTKLLEKEEDGTPIKIDTRILAELELLAGTWNIAQANPSDEDSDNEIAELGFVMTPGFVEGSEFREGKLKGTLMGDIIEPGYDNEDQLLGDI